MLVISFTFNGLVGQLRTLAHHHGRLLAHCLFAECGKAGHFSYFNPHPPIAIRLLTKVPMNNHEGPSSEYTTLNLRPY